MVLRTSSGRPNPVHLFGLVAWFWTSRRQPIRCWTEACVCASGGASAGCEQVHSAVQMHQQVQVHSAVQESAANTTTVRPQPNGEAKRKELTPLGDPRGRVCRVRATLGEQDTPFLFKENKVIVLKGKNGHHMMTRLLYEGCQLQQVGICTCAA